MQAARCNGGCPPANARCSSLEGAIRFFAEVGFEGQTRVGGSAGRDECAALSLLPHDGRSDRMRLPAGVPGALESQNGKRHCVQPAPARPSDCARSTEATCQSFTPTSGSASSSSLDWEGQYQPPVPAGDRLARRAGDLLRSAARVGSAERQGRAATAKRNRCSLEIARASAVHQPQASYYGQPYHPSVIDHMITKRRCEGRSGRSGEAPREAGRDVHRLGRAPHHG